MRDRGEQRLSSTLLMRLRNRDPAAWEHLVQLYGPLIYHWCRRTGLPAADAADVMQEVFRSVAENLGRFRVEGTHDSFHSWLAVITRHKICDHFRRLRDRPQAPGGTDFQLRLLQLPSPEDSDLNAGSQLDGERKRIVRRALGLIQCEFETRTWTMFWRTTVDGAPAGEVAAELEVSLNAVYKAKSRVLRRLRQELDGLL